jgi:hypothetical protein
LTSKHHQQAFGQETPAQDLHDQSARAVGQVTVMQSTASGFTRLWAKLGDKVRVGREDWPHRPPSLKAHSSGGENAKGSCSSRSILSSDEDMTPSPPPA